MDALQLAEGFLSVLSTNHYLKKVTYIKRHTQNENVIGLEGRDAINLWCLSNTTQHLYENYVTDTMAVCQYL